MGVASGKEVIDIFTINFSYSLVLALFWAAASLLLCSFLKMFFRSCKNKNKKPKWRLFTSLGAHLNCAIMAMLYTHSIGKQL